MISKKGHLFSDPTNAIKDFRSVISHPNWDKNKHSTGLATHPNLTHKLMNYLTSVCERHH